MFFSSIAPGAAVRIGQGDTVGIGQVDNARADSPRYVWTGRAAG